MIPSDCRGVWYACGTANTLPGHGHVYSGGAATYCAWHRPMALYAEEVHQTFFVYGKEGNAPTISLYDHDTQSFGRPVVLGSNPDGDAHRNPTLLIDEDGYLLVFWGAHSHHTRVLRSEAPYDILSWTELPPTQEAGTSYPQPWQLKAGEIFVSYRRRPSWHFIKSRDGGRSWDPPTQLISFSAEKGEGLGEQSVYAVSVAETGAYPRKVHIAWSRLGGGTPEEIQTKHLWARRYNVYYAFSEDGGTTWKRSDGTPYELPITEEAAEKVWDSGQHGVWLKDIQLDEAGDPYLVFVDAEVATYESGWKVARRAGDQWVVNRVTTSDHMYDDGALVVLSSADLRLYAPTTATQPQEDGGEIEEWRSRDRGATWRNTRHVTQGSVLSHN